MEKPIFSIGQMLGPTIRETFSESSVGRFSPNLAGRDFVVGDIHGCFLDLDLELFKLGFAGGVDRLFCVGDLVDRGPASAEVIDFLKRPGIHAVRGNHEQNLLECYYCTDDGLPDVERLTHHIRRSGLSWWKDISPDIRGEILRSLRALPVAFEVGLPDGRRVGVVHADVPRDMSWQTFLEAVENLDRAVLHTAMYGRQRVLKSNHEGVEGVDRLYVGHTIQSDGVAILGNVFVIDTGAYLPHAGFGDGRITVLPLSQLAQRPSNAGEPCALAI